MILIIHYKYVCDCLKKIETKVSNVIESVDLIVQCKNISALIVGTICINIILLYLLLIYNQNFLFNNSL